MINSEDIKKAYSEISNSVRKTPLEHHAEWSEKFHCKLFLKREDQQLTRSYKIRGALNCIQRFSKAGHDNFVCASAGNHAQGFAWACAHLGVYGTIYMPKTTPQQKLKRTAKMGGDWITIQLTGDTFDEAYHAARQFEELHEAVFVHPFDDEKIIQGQGTVGLEIIDQLKSLHEGMPDILIVPVGGGGLLAGLLTWFKEHSPQTKVIGIEPSGAPSMKESLKVGSPTTLAKIDTFVDGAAVQTPGSKTFQIIHKSLDKMMTIPEGKVCTSILEIYNDSAIVLEPAGALSLAALYPLQEMIKGKTVVSILSGGNNDINRMAEIQERSLLHEGLKHYFILRFAQRAGALRDFLDHILGPTDDITRFEYVKKTKREGGPALVGIEVLRPEDFQTIQTKMDKKGMDYTLINDEPTLFELLV